MLIRKEVVMSRPITRLAPAVFLLLTCIATLAVPTADALPKPAGPLGIWSSSNGLVYQAPDIPESTNVQAAFAFGDFWDLNDPRYEGLTFRQWIETTCNEWNVERFTGVVRLPTEGEVVNAPADTALYAPAWPPGMIQGAARFSRLSKIHGQIYGINIDDFSGPDTGRVHDFSDALKGKYVDASGVVHHDTPETTPQLKLFVVMYSGNTLAVRYRPFVDGINLWIFNQDSFYTNIDTYVTESHTTYPGKEISCGIYVKNGRYGWMTPAGLDFMYRHLLDCYDDGDVNGVMLFCGHWITMPNITRARWDADRLPALLDEVYYPFVGTGGGRVVDEGGVPVDGAFVTCSTVGRVSGDVLVRSKKLTDAEGRYDLAAWAGNRTTDSTLYYAVAEQDGRVSTPVSGWIKRGGETVLPDILLPEPAGVGHEAASGPAARRLPEIDRSPNPFRETTVIRYSATHTEHLRVRVLDIGGREIVTLADTWCSPGEHHTIWSGRDRSGEKAPAGMYFLRLEDGRGNPRASGRVLLLR
jgi:hypothetical protein